MFPKIGYNCLDLPYNFCSNLDEFLAFLGLCLYFDRRLYIFDLFSCCTTMISQFLEWKQKLELYEELSSGVKLKCQNGHFISLLSQEKRTKNRPSLNNSYQRANKVSFQLFPGDGIFHLENLKCVIKLWKDLLTKGFLNTHGQYGVIEFLTNGGSS